MNQLLLKSFELTPQKSNIDTLDTKNWPHFKGVHLLKNPSSWVSSREFSGMYWLRHLQPISCPGSVIPWPILPMDGNQKSGEVSPVEVGGLSHYLQGFLHPRRIINGYSKDMWDMWQDCQSLRWLRSCYLHAVACQLSRFLMTWHMWFVSWLLWIILICFPKIGRGSKYQYSLAGHIAGDNGTRNKLLRPALTLKHFRVDGSSISKSKFRRA